VMPNKTTKETKKQNKNLEKFKFDVHMKRALQLPLMRVCVCA